MTEKKEGITLSDEFDSLDPYSESRYTWFTDTYTGIKDAFSSGETIQVDGETMAPVDPENPQWERVKEAAVVIMLTHRDSQLYIRTMRSNPDGCRTEEITSNFGRRQRPSTSHRQFFITDGGLLKKKYVSVATNPFIYHRTESISAVLLSERMSEPSENLNPIEILDAGESRRILEPLTNGPVDYAPIFAYKDPEGQYPSIYPGAITFLADEEAKLIENGFDVEKLVKMRETRELGTKLEDGSFKYKPGAMVSTDGKLVFGVGRKATKTRGYRFFAL